MGRSYIADSIVQEQKRKEVFKNKERQNCKEKNCIECKWQKICVEYEVKNEI